MTSFVGGVQRTGPLHSGIGQLEWLSYQSGGSGNLENIGWVVPVPENTPEGTVEKVTAALLDRHEALRSTYGADPLGRPQQTVYRRVDPTFSAISSTEVRAFVDQPFAVATEPPIRFGCTDDGQLVFAVAHIAVDGLAAWILYKELAAALGEGGGTSEEPPAVQPLDHALREVGADRPRAEAALRHWEVVLGQVPVTVLPLTKGRRGADIVGAALDTRAALQALAILRPRLRSSPSSIFTAAACLALAIQYSRRRFGMSLTWAYRELSSTRNIVAAVFRDMPLMIDLDGHPSFDEVVARVQRAVLLNGRRMGFDVLEFVEIAGVADVEQGRHLPGPEVISCTFEGIDWDEISVAGDLSTLAGESRIQPIRTNLPQDVCNVYIRSHVVGDRISIQSRTDAATGSMDDPGDLVRLIEAILVHAATHESLTFESAERLARAPWRPDERWGRSGDVWIDLDFIAARLEQHPDVSSARVGAAEAGITALVRTDLDAWELRDFMLCTDNGRSAVVSPEFFVMERSDGTSVEGRGTDRPQLGPVSAADHALRDALDWTQGLGSATTAGTYLSVGGRMFLAPRVIGRLRAHGYGNITVDDFRRPISLRALAGLLRRLDCPGDAAPATLPE